MSSEDNENIDLGQEKALEILKEHSKTIINNFEAIDWVFEDSVGSDRIHHDFEDLTKTLSLKLTGLVEDGEEREVSGAIFGVVANFDEDQYRELEEHNKELANRIRDLSAEYGLSIQRRAQRIRQGQLYWNNVKSNLTVRSNRPTFVHELTIDYSDVIRFESGYHGTTILSRHFIEQVADAMDVLGKDVLSFLEENEIKQINEISETLLDELEGYESEEEILSLGEQESRKMNEDYEETEDTSEDNLSSDSEDEK